MDKIIKAQKTQLETTMGEDFGTFFEVDGKTVDEQIDQIIEKAEEVAKDHALDEKI